MVAVAVDAGWGKDGGETVEELQGREAERGAAREIRGREDVEHLVGAAADEVKAAQSERGPGAVADQALEAGSVVGLNVNAGVEAKTTTVLPGEHILGFVGLQDPLAANVAEDPLSDRMLEALQELGRESGGFVEADAVGWFAVLVSGLQTRIGLDPLKESIDDGQVKLVVGIERRAEPVQETHGSHRGRGRRRGARHSQGSLEGPEEDVEDGGGGLGAVVEEGPQALGDRKHELADRDVGEDMVHHMGGRLGHVAGSAGGTEVAPELVLDMSGHPIAHGVGFLSQG
jgi:hypothetical protein